MHRDPATESCCCVSDVTTIVAERTVSLFACVVIYVEKSNIYVEKSNVVYHYTVQKGRLFEGAQL